MYAEKLQLALVLSGFGLLLVEEEKKKRRRKIRRNRTKWVQSWILQRQAQGPSPNLEGNETNEFKHFARLFPEQFDMLTEFITPTIRRQNTNYRDCISVEERLMVTLRFLATGESFRSLSYLFRMGLSTIRQFVPETCAAIYQALKHKYLKCPESAEEWQRVAEGFRTQCDFPNCLGALDGKRISFRPPPGTGSALHSSTQSSSVVLTALVDSGSRFLCADVGGRSLQDALEKRAANIPAPAPLPASDRLAPYCVVAGEAFPLKENLMTPYPNQGMTDEQRVFNLRLSRPRRAAENAFGLLANRFRVFLTTINIQDAAKVEDIALACCTLHNFLQTEACDVYTQGVIDQEGAHHDPVPGPWRQDPALLPASLPHDANEKARAEQHRDELCRYFSSDCGTAPFQPGKFQEMSL